MASEKSNFVDHNGVEWDAIRKAWAYNQRQEELGKDKRRGGSTITQQLAKNLFLSGSRTYLRKGQELILAYMIEFVMDKRRILDLYLNLAQWGDRSEEHTSELQSLMRISYAVFCLKKKKNTPNKESHQQESRQHNNTPYTP